MEAWISLLESHRVHRYRYSAGMDQVQSHVRCFQLCIAGMDPTWEQAVRLALLGLVDLVDPVSLEGLADLSCLWCWSLCLACLACPARLSSQYGRVSLHYLAGLVAQGGQVGQVLRVGQVSQAVPVGQVGLVGLAGQAVVHTLQRIAASPRIFCRVHRSPLDIV